MATNGRIDQEAAERIAQCAADVVSTELASLLVAMTPSLGTDAVARILHSLAQASGPPPVADSHFAEVGEADADAFLARAKAWTEGPLLTAPPDHVVPSLAGLLAEVWREALQSARGVEWPDDEKATERPSALRRFRDDIAAELGMTTIDLARLLAAVKERQRASVRALKLEAQVANAKHALEG